MTPDPEFNVDIEFWVRGHLRSLKVAAVDRSSTTYYQSAIVTVIVLPCVVFESFDVE